MCIRDRDYAAVEAPRAAPGPQVSERGFFEYHLYEVNRPVCLLYTSDAADERSSVDLGGRRIIKKKKQIEE